MECQIYSVRKTTEEKRYVLNLNEKEARWLRQIMQNPLHDISPEEEWPEDRKMRKEIFDCLND